MKKYLPTLLTFFLLGCELVVDVDMPIEKNALVVNSFFTPDSTWKAKISLSRHILDEAPYAFVDDAMVVVLEEGQVIDTLRYDSLGYYRSNNGRPRAGGNYSIQATASAYGTATSSSGCPQVVQAEFSPMQVTVGEFGQPEYSVNIAFSDPPGNNFYQIMAISEYRYTHPITGNGFVNRSNIQVWSDDPGIDDEEIFNSEGFFFPDVLFDGENFSVNVKMSPNIWGSSTKAKYFIYFRTVSEDYYRYKTTAILQNNTVGDPFAQPVKVYNNIENGFGVFAGFTQQVLVVEQ